MITGSTAVGLEAGGPEVSSTRAVEQSIGSGTAPGSEWSGVTCGGALAGTGSKGYVIVQTPST